MLQLGGVSANELAETYGTPLIVMDLGAVDAALSSMTAACRPYGVGVSYAAKAFLAVEFARFLAAYDIGLDVCSLGELLVAERAGIPADRLTLHGAGKTRDELQAALNGRVGRIIVDGLDELRLLCSLDAIEPVDVFLRLNTGIEAHAHAYLQTAGDRTKFGITEDEEEEAAALLAVSPKLRLRGLHAHVGSQIYDSAAFVANGEALVETVARFTNRGFTIDTIVVGGGFGIPERDTDVLAGLDTIIRDIAEGVANRSRDLDVSTPRIEVEPGRSIVAQAGTTLYRVMAVKERYDRVFVIVDGGLGDNPRPALYGAYHPVVSVEHPSRTERVVTVCGRTCENDELATVALPTAIAAGNLVAMRNTGAYTYSMASNYNRFTRPAVVAVHNGSHRLFIRRESLDDVLRSDVDYVDA